MKETLKMLYANTRSPKSHENFLNLNNRKTSIIIMSLLGTWILCIPYEGQLLYTLARNYGIESKGFLDISLIMQLVGLILGGIFLKNIKAARKIITYSIPVCILCTITFFFVSYAVWLITLTVCSVLAGICISAFGYYIRNYIKQDNRFRTAAVIILNTNILKMLINNISLYVSIQTGFALTIIILGAAWYLIFKMPLIQDKKTVDIGFDKKTGFKALILLFLFIAVIGIDFGISIETINPQYESLGWLTSWYWLLPYACTALFMKRLKNADHRNSILYSAVGMIGFGFISFVLLDHSISGYLIVNTVMMAAWAISDVFWFSILLEMLEMVKSAAIILSVGFSATMIGVLLGKIIADNYPINLEERLSIIPMAIICITLFILPIHHRLLSTMIKKNIKVFNITETKITNLPDGINTLTEREKQIAELLLKGRTCKLIAAELYLSENTVKTHIKNIYSKLGIKRKSELFKFMMEQTIEN